MAFKKKTTTAAASQVPASPLPPDDVVVASADKFKTSDALGAFAQARTAAEAKFSELNDLTLEAVRRVEELNRAIEIKQETLEVLGGKEVVTKSIQELNDQLEAARAAAQKEALERARSREAEETDWEFRFDAQKKAQEAAWNEQKLTRARAEEERVYKQNQEWAKREAALKEQEQELANLKLQAASFEQRVKDDVARQVAITKASIEREYSHKAQIDTMTATSRETVLNAKIAQLEAASRSKDDEIVRLQAQLQAANNQVAATAQKAMEAFSGQKALAAVQEAVATATPSKK